MPCSSMGVKAEAMGGGGSCQRSEPGRFYGPGHVDGGRESARRGLAGL